MTHNLAISLLLVSMLAACTSPTQQGYRVDYRIGSEVYRSKVAAEAAHTDVRPKETPQPPPDEKVRLLRAPMPGMPTEAIDAGLSDIVTVKILFDEAGDVESAVPISYKYPVLLDTVLAAVRKWKIDPSIEAGKRVKTMVQQSFRFEVP